MQKKKSHTWLSGIGALTGFSHLQSVYFFIFLTFTFALILMSLHRLFPDSSPQHSAKLQLSYTSGPFLQSSCYATSLLWKTYISACFQELKEIWRFLLLVKKATKQNSHWAFVLQGALLGQRAPWAARVAPQLLLRNHTAHHKHPSARALRGACVCDFRRFIVGIR